MFPRTIRIGGLLAVSAMLVAIPAMAQRVHLAKARQSIEIRLADDAIIRWGAKKKVIVTANGPTRDRQGCSGPHPRAIGSAIPSGLARSPSYSHFSRPRGTAC